MSSTGAYAIQVQTGVVVWSNTTLSVYSNAVGPVASVFQCGTGCTGTVLVVQCSLGLLGINTTSASGNFTVIWGPIFPPGWSSSGNVVIGTMAIDGNGIGYVVTQTSVYGVDVTTGDIVAYSQVIPVAEIAWFACWCC